MSTYESLKQQAAELLRQAEEMRASERQSVLQAVKETVAEWNFSMNELGIKPGKPDRRTKLPAKFRDPHTGKEWCGRGNMPKWMGEHLRSGGTKDQLAV